MAIQVVIKRKVKQGLQAKELVPLILHVNDLIGRINTYANEITGDVGSAG